MLRPRRTRLVIVAIAIAAALGCASTKNFPDAPILLVCPWAAGGGSDRVARHIATLLEQDLHVPVNVVNVTGGDGVTGHSRGAQAPPDGHTLTLITVEITTLHWRQMTSISHRDFTPLALVNRDAAALFVRADAPWRSVGDLEDAVRGAPGTLRASGTATAGIWHLGLAGWLTAVGLRPSDVTWVSIAGAAPSLAELMAGGVDVVSCSLAEAQALLESGRIRSLGVMAPERLERFPSVPTLAEQGVEFSLGTIRGIAVPANVPPDRVRVLADALRRVVNSSEYRNTMSKAGFTPMYEDPARFTLTLQETDARLGALLRSEAFAGLAVKQIGPMFFPGVLAGALAVVGIGLVIASRRIRSAAAPAPGDRAPNAPIVWRVAEPLLWIALYVALAERLGFLLTAGALLLAYFLRLGTRPRVAVVVTLVLVPAAYGVFAILLRVSLPRGILAW
jgi:tripartite-type tricarboxylate transporter receptor subunit TctC